MFRYLLLVALLLFGAHRLPAPIQEVVETPKPTPEQAAKAKTKRTSKPKVSSSEAERSKTVKPSVEKLVSQTSIAGTWTGRVSTAAGIMEFTLVINSAGTVVKETSSNFGAVTHPAVWDGKTGKWRSGASNIYSWSFTPNPDGKTAMAIITGPYISNPLAAFRRVSR